MISLHVSAVCHVRDGYTGKPLEASRLLCALDGLPCRPVGKPGGCLVLVNLSGGAHRLSRRCPGFQEEWVELVIGRETQEVDITMKPGENYPFRQTVTRLDLTVTRGGTPAPGEVLWLAVSGSNPLKLAQTKAEKGEQELRLYCKGPEAAVGMGAYLLSDEDKSEIVGLRSLEEEMGTLTAPLTQPHSRGKLLLPAQRYHTGEDGRVSAVFPTACTVEVYVEGTGLAASLTLEEGDNQETIQL